jgi:hypothetical protein
VKLNGAANLITSFTSIVKGAAVERAIVRMMRGEKPASAGALSPQPQTKKNGQRGAGRLEVLGRGTPDHPSGLPHGQFNSRYRLASYPRSGQDWPALAACWRL